MNADRAQVKETRRSQATAILPTNDLAAAEAFFARLDFLPGSSVRWDDYLILAHPEGAELHLTRAVQGWLVRGQNPFGIYLYLEDVDGMALRFAGEILEREGPSVKPWGMYEFAVNGPDDTLIRIGRKADAAR